MQQPRALSHADTLRLPVKQPFNFRYNRIAHPRQVRV